MLDTTVQIPLHGRTGAIRAYALIDATDAHLAAFRWCLLNNGYVKRQTGPAKSQRTLLLHREVMGLGPGDGLECDHVNRNRLDNRRSNLRVVTREQNTQNVPSRGLSRFRGVTWDASRQKWTARVTINGRCYNLGRFDDELSASRVAKEFRGTHMPYSVD